MATEARYEIREAKNDAGFYFVLIAKNGEVVLTSETYTRQEDAQRGIVDASRAAAEAGSSKT